MQARRESGRIAHEFGEGLPIEIIEGDVGFYLGTRDDGLPFSRESEEYFATRELARPALSTGRWTQRERNPHGQSVGHRPDHAVRR